MRLLSIAKKLEPPIACSIVMTTNSASARSLGAAWMVMRSRRSRTISAIGSSASRGDDLRGSGDDGAARAVVAPERDRRRARIIAAEALEAGGIGAAKAVDRLMRIADGAEIAGRRRRELREQPVLPRIDVLELIDADEAEAGAIEPRDLGIVREEPHRQTDQIVEIDPVVGCQHGAIGGPRRRDFPARLRLATLRLGDGADEIFRARARQAERRGERGRTLRLAGDAEAGLEAGGCGVLAQDREPERVEGVDGDAARVRAEHCMQALAHFRRGPAREGDGQALRAGDAAIGDEMRDAMDQGAGLARARPGNDQQRTFNYGRRRALIGVER